MAATFTIPTIFTAVDKFSSPVHKMAMTMESFSTKANATIARSERLFRKLTPAISEASKQMLSMVGTAAIVGSALALGTSSIKSIMDYETAIQSLQAVTGVSNNELVFFKSEISDVATSSRKSAIDVAKSFEVIGSAMSQYLSDPKALRSISEAGITLSKASRMELEPTLQALTSVMNQFGLEANMANDTINRLTAGEIVGSISTSKISEYLQEFGASAKLANINVGESVALIEALGIQMSHDKIAVGARNLLTVLDSAKGLDKAALASLSKAGVSTALLMDKSKSLGERLRELSKIKNDAVGITKVFGKENKTAAQVIFAQLDKYDEFEKKIQTTNKAQEQASINSNTLANRLEELKNSWINMLTSSSSATNGLNIAKKAIQFVTDNLETIVSVGIGVVKFFLLWKAAIITSKVAMIAYNVAFGIYNALTKGSIFLTEGNVVAKYADLVVTNLMTAAQTKLNIATYAFPAVWIMAAIAALAAGIIYLASQVTNWGEIWEKTYGTITYTLDAFGYFFKAVWSGIVDYFQTAMDSMVIAYFTAQNLMGQMSDTRFNKEVSNILQEQALRKKIIKENEKLALLSAVKAGQNYNDISFKFKGQDAADQSGISSSVTESAANQMEINRLLKDIGKTEGEKMANAYLANGGQVVNPKAAQQKSMEQTLIKNTTTTDQQKLKIEVIGLPEWMKLSGANNLQSVMPVTTSTMKK